MLYKFIKLLVNVLFIVCKIGLMIVKVRKLVMIIVNIGVNVKLNVFLICLWKNFFKVVKI